MNDDPRPEREKFVRIPAPLHAQWLERCHRESIDPDQTAAIKLGQALRHEGSLLPDRDADEEE